MTLGIFDGHCDTLTTLKEHEHLYDAQRHFNFKQAEEYPYFTQVLAVWVDAAREDVDRKVERFIGKFYEELARNPSVTQIKTRQDMERCRKGVNVILGIEGGEALGRELGRVEAFYKKGVRLITLTWNNPYAISDTCVKTADRLNGEADYAGGLTHFGRDVLREMNRFGIMADVSHLSDKGFYDVAEIAEKPFIASHSNARALCPHPRN
ncbi:MAG TPA: dipeptidase, partial [Clostridiales bacterium]|nr:dipeptidase [Clostridiales bacterium]